MNVPRFKFQNFQHKPLQSQNLVKSTIAKGFTAFNSWRKEACVINQEANNN